MHIYVELWTAKEAWRCLPRAERDRYIAAIKPHIDRIKRLPGVELISLVKTHDVYPDASGHTYAAVWRMPSVAECEHMERIVEDIQWDRYFEQVNFRGDSIEATQLIAFYMAEGT